MGTLVYAIIQAPNWGWGSTSTVAAILAGVAILAAFVAVEARAAQPMLDVGLFRNMRFTAASGSVTIAFFALTGFTFLITQYFQFVKNYTPLGTGVRLLPVAISLAVASIVGTRLAVSIGNKAVVAAGLSLFAIGLFWIAANDASTSYLVIAAQMIVGGGGVGLITAPATESILGVVPTEKAGVGSAVNDATRLFGSALGVAVIGSVAASLYSSRLNATMPHGLPHPVASAATNSVGSALVAAKGLQHAGQSAVAQQLAGSATGAFLHSFAGGCIVAGLVSLLGALVAATFLPTRPTAPDTTTAAEPVAVPVTAAPVAQ
jgi:Na+/melibiose symporter-like transporter